MSYFYKKVILIFCMFTKNLIKTNNPFKMKKLNIFLIAFFVFAFNSIGQVAKSDFYGMWSLKTEDGGVGWLNVNENDGFLDADLLWRGGSVSPVSNIYFINKKLDVGKCEKIDISKVQNLVPVQQKSLKKIDDRILNAQKTIQIDSSKVGKNVLLIDDVTGSGATLNQTAKKIIEKNNAQNVYAFTITGSAKSGVFDVISEA